MLFLILLENFYLKEHSLRESIHINQILYNIKNIINFSAS